MLSRLKKSSTFVKRFPNIRGSSDGRDQRVRQFLDKVEFNWLDYGVIPPVRDQFDAPCCLPMALSTTVSAHFSILLKMMVLYILSHQFLIDKTEYSNNLGVSIRDCANLFKHTGVCLEHHYPTTVDMKKSSDGGGPPVGARVKVDGFKCFKKKPKFKTVCKYIKKHGPLYASIYQYKGFDRHKGEGVFKHREDMLLNEVDKKINGDDEEVSSDDEDISENDLVDICGDDEETIKDVPKKLRIKGHGLCVVGYDSATRSLLVQNSYGTSFGVEGLALIDFRCFNGLFAYPINPHFDYSSAVGPLGVPKTSCLLLKNVFGPATEKDPDFDVDLENDVRQAFSIYGTINHIHVDKISAGHVYLTFESLEAASCAQKAMQHGSFGERLITAVLVESYDNDVKFKGPL